MTSVPPTRVQSVPVKRPPAKQPLLSTSPPMSRPLPVAPKKADSQPLLEGEQRHGRAAQEEQSGENEGTSPSNNNAIDEVMAAAALSPSMRPNRPVPIPPGKTIEDFSFLFGPTRVKESTPLARLAAARENQTRRMSVMNLQPLRLPLPSAPASPSPPPSLSLPLPDKSAIAAVVAASASSPVTAPSLSPRPDTPTGLLSPRSERKVGSKSDRVTNVMQRIAAANHTWTQLSPPPPPAVMEQIVELVAGREQWSAVDDWEMVPAHLLYLAKAFLASFPRDVLLTPVLKDLFVSAALVEDQRRRRLSFFSLYSSLPAQHEVLLRSVLEALGRLDAAQLGQAAELFASVMGSAKVVERLTEDFALVIKGDFEGELTFDAKSHLLTSTSRGGIIDLLLDPHYELLEPQFTDMAALTSRCFATDGQLVSLITERFAKLMSQQPTADVLQARESLLMFMHHFLLNHSGRLSDDFGPALSLFKAALGEHSEGGEESAVHIEYLMHFSIPSLAIASPQSSDRLPSIATTAASSPAIPTSLSLTVQEWTAALTLAASDIFRSVVPDDVICRNWDRSTSFKELREYFNNLQLFVATAVLVPEDRAAMLITLEHWVQVASALVAARNFHAAFAVYAGLSMPSVGRLKGLWESIPAKVAALMEELQLLFDPSKNHQNYQKVLDATTDNESVVPNMVLILKWLFTIEEVNPTLLSNGNVSFEKLRMLFIISQKISALQQRPPYVGSAPVECVAFCRSMPAAAYQSEAALFDLSLLRIPRAADGVTLKLSLRTQVSAAMIRARTSTEQRRKGSVDVPTSPIMRASAGARSGSISAAPGVTLSRHSDGGAARGRGETTVQSPSTVLKRGMVCPLCVKPFLDKSDLLLHIEEANCGSAK